MSNWQDDGPVGESIVADLFGKKVVEETVNKHGDLFYATQYDSAIVPFGVWLTSLTGPAINAIGKLCLRFIF